MKITKSEQILLDRARDNPHKVVSVTTRLRFALSVKHIEGSQELKAALRLVERNLLQEIDIQEIDREKSRDRVGLYTTYTFRLANKGD